MCNWVTLLYSRKFQEHFKPAIMEKKSLAKTKKQKTKKNGVTAVAQGNESNWEL